VLVLKIKRKANRLSEKVEPTGHNSDAPFCFAYTLYSIFVSSHAFTKYLTWSLIYTITLSYKNRNVTEVT